MPVLTSAARARGSRRGGRRYRCTVQRVHGVVQHYAWGDPVFIPSLLGVEPDGEPWAELWIGTHPSGPATLDDGRPLSDVAGELPYLLKVLAAAEPLSLQAHPDADQARDGYARGDLSRPERQAGTAVRAHRVRRAVRHPPRRRHDWRSSTSSARRA